MAAPFLMTNADYVWTPMTTVTLFILSLIIFLIFIKTKDVVHLTIFILNLLFSVKSRLLCKMLYNVFTISTYQN